MTDTHFDWLHLENLLEQYYASQSSRLCLWGSSVGSYREIASPEQCIADSISVNACSRTQPSDCTVRPSIISVFSLFQLFLKAMTKEQIFCFFCWLSRRTYSSIFGLQQDFFRDIDPKTSLSPPTTAVTHLSLMQTNAWMLNKTVYLCRHIVWSPRIILPHNGCGSYGIIKETGHFGQTTKKEPCPDCIANGIHVKVNRKFRRLDLATPYQ